MNKALAKFASSFYYNGSMDVEGECLESSTIHDFGEIQKGNKRNENDAFSSYWAR